MIKSLPRLRPQVFHDLHESVTLLYVSTGTGPYNPVVDPIQMNEWWLLAQTEIMEMTKRGVPGVWTYNYYDGWVPNYMFWIGVTHNSIGRFYETQSYGGAVQPCRSPRATRAANGTGRIRARRRAVGRRAQREHAAVRRLLIAINHVARRTRRCSSRTTTSRTSSRSSTAGTRRRTPT